VDNKDTAAAEVARGPVLKKKQQLGAGGSPRMFAAVAAAVPHVAKATISLRSSN
jgi:hypothetical protein